MTMRRTRLFLFVGTLTLVAIAVGLTISRNKPTAAAAASGDPVAQGQLLFRDAANACSSCHSIQPGIVMAGPSLADIGRTAAERIASATYKGKAKDADAYIHESIIDPSAFLVPGAAYSTGRGGMSLMPPGFGERLTAQQIDQLVAYLSSLR